MTVEQLEQRVLERTTALLDSNQQLRREIQRLTDREAALRESEEQFHVIFEQSAAGCVHMGLDGTIMNINPRICELFGYTRDQLLTKRWADLTHPEDLARNSEKAEQMLEQMLSGEISSYSTEKRYLRRDGSTLWVDLTTSLIRAANGQPKYFASVIVDISQRKHAEELLHKNEERLQSILDHTTAVIYIKEPGGCYELINRRFEELFHITNQQIAGRTDFEVFPHEWAQKFRANDLRVLETRLPWELEEVVLQDDGLHTYVSVKVPILDATGRAIAICGISTDITERKRAESAIHQAMESAEQASSAKSRFLANISHEIRTPIMAILGAAELIRGGELAGDQVHHHGDVILRSGRHLLSLVDDLLDQSRIDSGRLDVVRDSCCLPEIMADVYAVTVPFLKHQVDLQIIYEKSVPEFINTDRTRLTQALINLVHNAIKFTSRGHVHVKVSLEHVENSPFLTICVEDTGQGIAHTDLNRIFEPFTQLGNGNQNPPSGMGLGLPLARWIAQRLGGSLDVRSTPGEGSVFTLRVPVGPLVSQEWITPDEAEQWWRVHRKKSPTPSMTLCGTVLLADDSEDIQRLLAYALKKAGATVVAVSDGRSALDAARQRHFDLILLDIRMPEMNGWEAAKAIRLAGYSGPLIALTASTTKTQQDLTLEAGFDDLWPKPISLEHLVELASAFLPSSPAPKEPGGDELKDRLESVRREFALGLPQRMDRLQRALENGDTDATGEILHQLLGSSGIVGFMDLSAQAQLVYAHFKSGLLTVQSAELNRLLEIARNLSAR
jgi:PAS domain S-box-containing protein